MSYNISDGEREVYDREIPRTRCDQRLIDGIDEVVRLENQRRSVAANGGKYRRASRASVIRAAIKSFIVEYKKYFLIDENNRKGKS